MNRPMYRTVLRRCAVPASTALALLLALSACGGQSGAAGGLTGQVQIDGSSTVEPLSSAASELFSEQQPQVQVTVGSSGTGGGFESFCNGRTDISDASRAIEPEEARICKQNGIEYTELQVATDALTVVANKNVPVDCLTVEQLRKVWAPQSKVDNWNEIDPSFPDLPLQLFGPGTDSGTFDYFTEAVNGEEGASRADYEASEDDNVIVEGVANTEGGLGYFGYTYYEQNADRLKALEIDSGDGCVAPWPKTAQSGAYTPLARPLYIYVDDKSYAQKPQVAAFVDFYVENLGRITKAAQYIQLNQQQLQETRSEVRQLSG